MKTRLRELRERRGLSQRQLAENLNVTRSSIEVWENASSIPTVRLLQLANFFEINIDYLVGLTNRKIYLKSSNTINKSLVSSRTREIRKELNMTLREISELLNTSSSTWSAYETQKTIILSSFLVQTCKKSKISIDYVLGRTAHKYILK